MPNDGVNPVVGSRGFRNLHLSRCGARRRRNLARSLVAPQSHLCARDRGCRQARSADPLHANRPRCRQPARILPDTNTASIRRIYFYPASTIKLAGALLALEKLNQLGLAGVDLHTPVRIDSAYSRQTAVREDPTAPDGLPTIAHYIRKLFAVSDNDAYNRLYEFVGQQRLNEGLWEKGYRDVRLTHRLAIARSPEENRHTNPLAFYRGDQVLYRQPLLANPHTWRAPAPIPKGEGHIRDGTLW